MIRNERKASPHAARQPTAIDAVVGARLRLARHERGLSIQELAQWANIAPQQVHKYEVAQTRISVSRLHQFSQLLNKPIEWFFIGL